MSFALPIPLWLVALALAAAAPFCVRALEVSLQARLRARTLEAIARARALAETQRVGETQPVRRAGVDTNRSGSGRHGHDDV
jgi:hypothetical protein